MYDDLKEKWIKACNYVADQEKNDNEQVNHGQQPSANDSIIDPPIEKESYNCRYPPVIVDGMTKIDYDEYAKNYLQHTTYQRLDRNNRDKESCHIPLDEKIFIKDSVRTFLDDTYQLLMDRFKGYKHVYITQIKKHGCWCLRHIQEGILA